EAQRQGEREAQGQEGKEEEEEGLSPSTDLRSPAPAGLPLYPLGRLKSVRALSPYSHRGRSNAYQRERDDGTPSIPTSAGRLARAGARPQFGTRGGIAAGSCRTQLVHGYAAGLGSTRGRGAN